MEIKVSIQSWCPGLYRLLLFLSTGRVVLVSTGRKQWHPTPVILPGKPHGWRSLVGCSPWGR